MADDLFEDTSMTFGEHIEELRAHLIRAIWGLAVAFLVMIAFGNTVVKIIVDPVEKQLDIYYKKHLEKRANEWVASDEALPVDQRGVVPLEATIPPDQVREMALAMGAPVPADRATMPAITLKLQAPVGAMIKKLAMPMATVSGKTKLKTLSAPEAFMIYFKAVLGASLVVASPWVFYQIYSFIAVGLYAHERRFVNLTLPFSIGLFLSGVAVCYYLVFPAMLKFFLSANDWMDLEPDFRLSEWVGFAVVLTIIFGAVFQMPLLMLMLERVGIITHEQLAGQRKVAVLVNFAVAAVITPGGDPNTMVLLALPMCVLFELGLLLMRYFQRRNPFTDESSMDEFA